MTSERSDELIHQLGQAALADDRLNRRDWVQLSLVCIVEPGVLQVNGYAFDKAGEATPVVPGDDDVDDLFRALHDAMRAEKDADWKSCLVRIKRPDLKLTIDFEYQDPLRWKATADNLDSVVEAMRA